MHHLPAGGSRCESGDTERAHVCISGQVQGVFFRDSDQAEGGATRPGRMGEEPARRAGRSALRRARRRRSGRWSAGAKRARQHASVENVDTEFETPAETSKASRCVERQAPIPADLRLALDRGGRARVAEAAR